MLNAVCRLGLGWLAASCLILSVPASGEQGAAVMPPRNVILIIGDGLDDHQITAARNYLVGARGALHIDRLSGRSVAQVLTLEEDPPHKPAYVADSANGGTSLATGATTSIGRISTTVEDQDVPTILELARDAGYRTGVVTTSSVTDATPASFLAHVAYRTCEGPDNMDAGMKPYPNPGCADDKKSAGGPGSIAEQIVTSGVDVVLGGGRRQFSQSVAEGGTTVRELAAREGFVIVDSPDKLANVSDGPVLGLFAPSTLPVKLRGPKAVAMTFDSKGSPTSPPPRPVECTANPGFDRVPSLATMTGKAMDLLSRGNDKGFFLMVESASIDKQAHRRNACGHIGEMQQLDEVVGLVLDRVQAHSDTLVIVTSDHGHAMQVLSDAEWDLPPGMAMPMPLGHVTRLLTADGAVLRLGYATSSWIQEEHTGTAVPVMASGVTLPSFMHQTDVFGLMVRHLGLTEE